MTDPSDNKYISEIVDGAWLKRGIQVPRASAIHGADSPQITSTIVKRRIQEYSTQGRLFMMLSSFDIGPAKHLTKAAKL
jgi:hypothetical protein